MPENFGIYLEILIMHCMTTIVNAFTVKKIENRSKSTMNRFFHVKFDVHFLFKPEPNNLKFVARCFFEASINFFPLVKRIVSP